MSQRGQITEQEEIGAERQTVKVLEREERQRGEGERVRAPVISQLITSG